MTAESFEGQYVWHPAADDRSLANACLEVRAGRYRSAHEVIAETYGDVELRAHRSLILASEACDSDLAECWIAEDPTPEAALMWARVATLRALHAADKCDDRASALERIARAACVRASAMAPRDPTPWVAQLALARLHTFSERAPNGLLTAPVGPWKLFMHILRIDPFHREAHHRFLSYFFSRHGGSVNAAWDVAGFLAQRAPANSPLRLLPLVALVESHKPSEPLSYRTWEQPQWRSTALAIYQNWFPYVADYRFTPVVDLAYLAHALLMAQCTFEARAVLVAMEPYASCMPWSAFGEPAAQLSRARRICGLPIQGTS
ncbi:hypothetical protein ABT272_41460 [Streptomyces sp900105245]|uniref:DUF4034 domain-containing protein n=1 Tax=Streptomyces sp. 900105245 TaxID=3154379 RepID=A0ABV1UKP9_9ACTN